MASVFQMALGFGGTASPSGARPGQQAARPGSAWHHNGSGKLEPPGSTEMLVKSFTSYI
jgi:hypothetical protein